MLPESYSELNKLYGLLENNPKLEVKIEGYTDNKGNKQNNLILSEKRAKAVVNYLISKGINKSRLKYIGYGSSKPKLNNETSKGRAANRRVEFVILVK